MYLYENYEGMPRLRERNIDLWGNPASDFFEQKRISDRSSTWAMLPLESAKRTISKTGYLRESDLATKSWQGQVYGD